MARFCPLFSGSSGNCTYVGNRDCGILVDAGGTTKNIELALRQIDVEMKQILGVVITHEHSDHVKALPVLTKRYQLPVYGTQGTLSALVRAGSIAPESPLHVMNGKSEAVGDFYVKAFHTSHDAAESCGYVIHLPDGRRVAIATDMGYVSDEVREHITGCDLVMIESNHDVRMLQNGRYPYYLKRRILGTSGHLSNDACAEEVARLAQTGTTRFVLAHLSQDNNLPELAQQTAAASLCALGCVEGVDYELSVARRLAVSDMTVF